MKNFGILLCASAIFLHVSGSQRADLEALASRLADTSEYSATCSYDVLLATLSEPVKYSVDLRSEASPDDTLAPCNYVIDWTVATPSGEASGFSAYFDGSHFRFHNKRLQEYHASEDSTPFAPEGMVSRGVQNQVQFADLLPQFIGRRFLEMAADTTYIYRVTPDTIVSGRPSTVVKGVRRTAGYDALEYTYIFDRATLAPAHIELENNPGQISEQSISVDYHSAKTSDFGRINLDNLIRANGEAFEKYRESTFSLENLPGRPLPEISAPTLGSERYFHASGSGFGAPTIFVFLDSNVGSTDDVIKVVRSAVALSPRTIEVVWAFLDHRADVIEEVMPKAQPGETVLRHAGGAARDCGVGAITPVIIFVGSDGSVNDFTRGFNRELESIVIQKANLCN